MRVTLHLAPGLSGLAALALVAGAAPAAAQLSCQVVPVKHTLAVEPEKKVAREVSVSNQGDAPVVVRVRLSDWTLDPTGDWRFLPLGSSPNTIAACVEFEPREFSLEPGESRPIALRMSLPATGPATRWGVLLSEVRPVTLASGGFGPRATVELGTTIYLTRVASQAARAEVTAFTAVARGPDSLDVTLVVRNAGERHFYLAGSVSLADSLGLPLGSQPLPTGVVLPGATRQYTWPCHAGSAPGPLQATATLDTGEPELLIADKRITRPIVPRERRPVAVGSALGP